MRENTRFAAAEKMLRSEERLNDQEGTLLKKIRRNTEKNMSTCNFHLFIYLFPIKKF